MQARSRLACAAALEPCNPSDAPLHAQHGRCAALAGAGAVAPRRGDIQRERHGTQEAGRGLGLRGQHARPQPRVRAQLQAR